MASDLHGTPADPDIEESADSDDSEFDSESESEFYGSFDGYETSEDEDEDEDEDSHMSTSTSTSISTKRQEHLNQEADSQLRELTLRFQTEYLRQPKSTQLILSHEASELYRSYQQHGSAARLSAGVLSFLEGGDAVYRSTSRVVREDELDAAGVRTGRVREVKKDVVERARLRFAPLPPLKIGRRPSGQVEREGRNREESNGQNKGLVVVGGGGGGGGDGKRKMSDDDDGESQFDTRERSNGPAGGFGHHKYDGDGGGAGGEEVSSRRHHVPVRAKATAGTVTDDGCEAMDIADEPGESHFVSRQPDPFGGGGGGSSGGRFLWSNSPDQSSSTSPKGTSTSSAQAENHNNDHDGPSHPHPYPHPPTWTASEFPTRPAAKPVETSGITSTNTGTVPIIPSHLYSLTTDPETQALLLGDKPQIPFEPLAGLKVRMPTASSGSLPPPASIEPIISRILALHSHAAVHFYHALVQKYTSLHDPSESATRVRPPPLQPPAALFRLAITTHLQSNLAHIFTPLVEHPLAFDAPTRALLRDVFDRYRPATLNPLERSVLARACGVDPESVQAWWDDRNRELVPWNALRRWIEGVERCRIDWARRTGRY